MNKETLIMLQQSEDLRVRSIAKLALIVDISFEDEQRFREELAKEILRHKRKNRLNAKKEVT